MVEGLADFVMVVSVEVMMLRDAVTSTSQICPNLFFFLMNIKGIPDLVTVDHQYYVVVRLFGFVDLSDREVSELSLKKY